MASYKELFFVDLIHKFYTDERSPSFVVEPDAATAKLMSGLKLLFRAGSARFRVLFQEGEDGDAGVPKIPIPEDTTFRFLLKTTDRRMINFTDLPEDYRKESIYRFRNNSGAGNLPKSTIDLTKEDRIAEVFATIEIRNFHLFDDPEDFPQEYSLTFKARRTYWTYMIVLPEGSNYNDYRMRVRDVESDFSDVRYSRFIFRSPVNRMIGLNRKAFKITTRHKEYIFQEARKKLELQERSGSWNTVIDHLPNLDLGDLSSTVYVYI